MKKVKRSGGRKIELGNRPGDVPRDILAADQVVSAGVVEAVRLDQFAARPLPRT